MALWNATVYMVSLIFKYRSVLWYDVKIEFNKKYAGSALGFLWVFLYPTLLLSIYIFVYVGVFHMTLEGSVTKYIFWVFCGIIPFLGISEGIQGGCQSIKQNIHLVKNVIFPIELIPIRVVLLSIVTELISLLILLILLLGFGKASFHFLWFPVVMFLQCLFLFGTVWILAVLAVFLQDITYFVNLATFMLFFLAPICFFMDMLDGWKRLVLYFNPLTYVVEIFRHSLFYQTFPSMTLFFSYTFMCLFTFALGSYFFVKFKDTLVDYE